MASKGRVSTAPTQKRRVMLTSSGLAALAVTVRGSRAMPQMGQAPGPSRTICGCMGQVYSVRSAWGEGSVASSAMPHFGQAPGFAARTSGCMGQVYWPDAGAIVRGPERHQTYRVASRHTWQGQPRTSSGIRCNRNTKYVPRARPKAVVFCGTTFIPHTGSTSANASSTMLTTFHLVRASERL